MSFAVLGSLPYDRLTASRGSGQRPSWMSSETRKARCAGMTDAPSTNYDDP